MDAASEMMAMSLRPSMKACFSCTRQAEHDSFERLDTACQDAADHFVPCRRADRVSNYFPFRLRHDACAHSPARRPTHPQVEVLLGSVATALHIAGPVAILGITCHIPLAPCA